MHLKKIHGSEDTSCTKTFIFTVFAATRCHPVLWEDPSSIPGKQKRQCLVSSYVEVCFFFL